MIGSIGGMIPLLSIAAIRLRVIGLALAITGWRRKPHRVEMSTAAAVLGVLALVLGLSSG